MRCGWWGLYIDYVRAFMRTSPCSFFCRSLSVSSLQTCRKKETERERQKDCGSQSRNGMGKAIQVRVIMLPKPDVRFELFIINREAVTNGKLDG